MVANNYEIHQRVALKVVIFNIELRMLQTMQLQCTVYQHLPLNNESSKVSGDNIGYEGKSYFKI